MHVHCLRVNYYTAVPAVEVCQCLLHTHDREASLEGVEINLGDAVRVRTNGDGLFIDSVIKIEAETQSSTTVNYSGGEQVGSSWIDKIMAVKDARGSEPEPSVGAQLGDCADDDEWGD